MLRRQKNLTIPDEAKKIACKAQQRLHKRYQAFSLRGENKNQIVTALGRELLGFLGAIAVQTRQCYEQRRWQERVNEKENPPIVLCGTGSGPNPRV